MTAMWIERQERANAYEPGDPLYRISSVEFKVMEEGVYWPGRPEVAENLRSVVVAELWLGNREGREPQVSWPSTADKRPELAMMLAHAMQFAAIEAVTGETARVFRNGGHFTPDVPLVSA